MPTPIELLLSPASLIVFGLYAALLLLEALAPGRPLPAVKAWPLRGLASFAVFFLLSSYLPLIWDRHLAAWQLLDLSMLGTFGGALAGLFVYEFCGYWYHRAMHASSTLFRTLHQMHHSAERLDAYSAFWFSPLDMIGWTFVTSASLVLIVGLTPEAATIAVLTITFLGIFQHTNLRTPRWLGYIVQRPESHSVHHGRGIHRYNYADLPVFDLVFGTFRNPESHARATGFYDGASRRVRDMLLLRDVSAQAPASDDTEPSVAARRS
ncbi:MAG TPA: sterol desaturase family protein [Steroidobacteraceae bacterium]|nr:sterol desaturase family protein [Steroidobacteraceae bacterium]